MYNHKSRSKILSYPVNVSVCPLARDITHVSYSDFDDFDETWYTDKVLKNIRHVFFSAADIRV